MGRPRGGDESGSRVFSPPERQQPLPLFRIPLLVSNRCGPATAPPTLRSVAAGGGTASVMTGAEAEKRLKKRFFLAVLYSSRFSFFAPSTSNAFTRLVSRLCAGSSCASLAIFVSRVETCRRALLSCARFCCVPNSEAVTLYFFWRTFQKRLSPLEILTAMWCFARAPRDQAEVVFSEYKQTGTDHRARIDGLYIIISSPSDSKFKLKTVSTRRKLPNCILGFEAA